MISVTDPHPLREKITINACTESVFVILQPSSIDQANPSRQAK